MRKCANCGLRYPMKEGRCPECSTHAKTEERPRSHPLGYPQCEWEVNGQRCRYPGSMSSNIGDGPWFCRHHYACDDVTFGEQVVIASRDYKHHTKHEQTAELTALARKTPMVKKVPQVKLGGLEWAKKIMDRLNAGESVPQLAEQWAKEVLGK